MFTGLIEEIGTVTEITSNKESAELWISCSEILHGTNTGDSICVNGVCLTATQIEPTAFAATAVHETLTRTNLGGLTKGSHVNLERSLTLQSRLGGHMVQGHVDGTAVVVAIHPEGDSQRWDFKISPDLARQIIMKGSITVNGVSLTVAGLTDNGFSVALIPTTLELTIFQYLKVGSSVNIETDMIGKYVFQFMENAR